MRPRHFSLLLGLVLAAVFGRVFCGMESFYFRDFGLFGYPLAYYHKQSLWQGELPLWNPLNACGLPFLAQWNTLVLYPGSLIYLLLPLPWSLNLFCLAHLFLAGLGMYFLAWQWTQSRPAATVAGLSFALSGLLLGSLIWPNNIAVLGWMPWVVWRVERAWLEGGRQVLVAGIVGAMQMLAGTPELILLTWVLVGLLWLGQVVLAFWPAIGQALPTVHAGGVGPSVGALCRRFGLAILMVVGLSAAQLGPFLDLLAHSQRSSEFGAASWAMPWWGAANFLAPLFHCFRSHQGIYAQYKQFWVSSYYVNLGVIVLAGWALWRAASWRVWLLAGLAAVCLVLAMGEAGVVYELLRRTLPFLGFMRFPIKFIVPVVFVLPLLGACALARWEGLPHGDRSKALRQLGLIAAGLVAATALILLLARYHPLAKDDWPATWRNALGRVVALATLAGLWVTYECARLPRLRRLLGLAMVLVLALDGLTHLPRHNPTVPGWVMEPGVAELQPRPKLGQARAMLSPAAQVQLDHWELPNSTEDYLASRLGLFCNCNLLDGIPKVDGFYSLFPRWYSVLLERRFDSVGKVPGRLAAFLGASHLTAEGKKVSWVTTTNRLPLITAGQRPVFAADEETLAALVSSEFRPEVLVYLPLEARGGGAATNAARARLLRQQWGNQEIECEVEADRPSWVVFAQSAYHCWRATVNDEPRKLWRANFAFQAVEVPAGRSRVRLVYVDRVFQAGWAVSLLTALGCLGGWWRRRRRGE